MVATDSAAVLVLAGADFNDSNVLARLAAAGYPHAVVTRSVSEAQRYTAALTADGFAADSMSHDAFVPEVLIIDASYLGDSATADTIVRFVKVTTLPVIYLVQPTAEQLSCTDAEISAQEITCTLAVRELSLAIRLALARPRAITENTHGIVSERLITDESGARLARSDLADEIRWRHLLASTPAVLYSCRPSELYQFVFVSENARGVLGYEASDLLNTPWFWLERIHADDRSRVISTLSELLMHAGDCDRDVIEYRVAHADGTYRWILDTRRPVCAANGDILEFVGSWLDITERRNAEDALKHSEERLKNIIEDQTELICRYLPDGTLTFVNDAYCRYFDQRAEDLIGHSFMPLIPEEDRELARTPIASLSPDNPVSNTEHRVILANGEIRWLNWTDRVILDGHGQVIEHQAVGRDVTERRLADEAVRKSEERYASMFQMATVSLWEQDISDLDSVLATLRARGVTNFHQYFAEHPGELFDILRAMRIVDVNNETCKMLGAQNRAELLGALDQTVAPESMPGLMDLAVACAEGRSRYEGEHIMRTLQGELITVLVRVSFPKPHERLENMLVSCVDISQRKRFEEQIQKLNIDLRRRAAELQAANQELESFSYSVSHDLRAPLRAIDGFSLALLEDYEDTLDEDGQRYLQRVRVATQRMAQLIDDLLSLSRMTRSEMSREKCDLSAMAWAVVRELRKNHPERVVEVSIASDLEVNADPNLLSVLLENLLGNAWKFTAKKPRSHIELGVIERDGQTVYFVRDDGAGFDMTYANKLFGPFQRLHGVHEFEGTGIGLATVKRIAHRHGGEVWGEGEVDRGATFTFTLS